MRPPWTDFRRRLKARKHLLGTFIKTPTTHATEILGALGFDFVVIDQEHSPFDRVTIDMLCWPRAPPTLPASCDRRAVNDLAADPHWSSRLWWRRAKRICR